MSTNHTRVGVPDYEHAVYHPCMTSDLDICRAANELIKQFGDAADIEAAMRADERLAAGDLEGEAVWLPIGRAIEELRQREPGDRAVHCRLLLACHQFSRPADPRINFGVSR